MRSKLWLYAALVILMVGVRGIFAFYSERLLSIPTGQSPQNFSSLAGLSPEKVRLLKQGRVEVLGVSNLPLSKGAKRSSFKILVILPSDLERRTFARKRELLMGWFEQAAQLRVDVVVEPTAADLFHSSPVGSRLARFLHEEGILRVVVFDGGHHVVGMPLQPDVYLIPRLLFSRKAVIAHWFARDAVLEKSLLDILKKEKIRSAVAEFKYPFLVKTQFGMSYLARRALVLMLKEHPITKGMSRPPFPDVKASYGVVANDRGAVFLSVDYCRDPEKLAAGVGDLLRKVSGRPRIVYLGLTYGLSSFPRIGPEISPGRREIEESLTKRLKLRVRLVSHPASAWDYYTIGLN